jgi:hypothetical protein
MPADLKSRYAALHREMVEQFERTAAVENHWLMYLLLGWEYLTTCAVSHYLLEVLRVQVRWPYAAVWLTQIVVAAATARLVTGRPQVEESPLEPINRRLWLMFQLLCINVAVLNIVSGQPSFAFLPALAVLSSFGFTVLTTVISRRFMVAGLTMFVTGVLMAVFPAYRFLIFGGGWLLILQSLAVVFLLKRQKWLATMATLPERVGKGPHHLDRPMVASVKSA